MEDASKEWNTLDEITVLKIHTESRFAAKIFLPFSNYLGFEQVSFTNFFLLPKYSYYYVSLRIYHCDLDQGRLFE